jgi:hypothetical protein
MRFTLRVYERSLTTRRTRLKKHSLVPHRSLLQPCIPHQTHCSLSRIAHDPLQAYSPTERILWLKSNSPSTPQFPLIR